MPRLVAYDRVIDSAVELPGALAASDDAAIDWHVALTRDEGAPPYVAGCHWDNGQLDWTVNPTVRHVVADRMLTVHSSAAMDSRPVGELAIANGMPALGWIAGDIVLHAAAVVMPHCQRAFAIMAPSGGGKSTLLNELMQAGGSLVADDTLVLRFDTGRWMGSGLPGGWFMRVDGQSHRDFVAAPAGCSLQSAPIAAIFALSLSDDPPLSPIARLRGMAAVSVLLDNRHRPQVPRAMGSEGVNLQSMVRIAAQVPIFGLTRQRGRICLTDVELAAMTRLAEERVSEQ